MTVLRLVLAFWALMPFLWADSYRLHQQDVPKTMQEILKYHVERRALTPEVVQRALKNALIRFDPKKISLLQQEITPFLNLAPSELQRVVLEVERGSLDTFVALLQVFEHALERCRALREEAMRELVLEELKKESSSRTTYLSYARGEKELKERIKTELAAELFERKNGAREWSLERKERILLFLVEQSKVLEALYKDKEREEHNLALLTLKALAKSLDAHTAYYTPEEALEMRASLEKEFVGVGVVLKDDVDGIVIAGLLSGGPAERSGKIFAGDHLRAIDERSTRELSYQEVLDRLKEGKQLALTVVHTDGTEDRVVLKRERIALVEERAKCSFVPFADGVIGVIELPSFYESDGASNSERDIRECLRKLRKEGEIKGLVFDLRENAGGFLSQAVSVAGLFVRSGVIVVSKYAGGEMQYLRDVDPRIHYAGPLVVLTSKASASAAEIVAGALQDYGLALIVGDKRTYGKGSIQYQTLTDPEAKLFFKVTVGRYYTVSGRSTQINGVAADIHVPTLYSAYQIGERYLDYPLAADHIDPAFSDPLVDIQGGSLRWFQRYYLPNVQKPISTWRRMIPTLEKNSSRRLSDSPNFQLFLRSLKNEPVKGDWGKEDLQMLEAIDIVRDMVYLQA